jgi:hypothetical protein
MPRVSRSSQATGHLVGRGYTCVPSQCVGPRLSGQRGQVQGELISGVG